MNVARWLRFLGAKPQLVVPLAGSIGLELARCLRRERLPAHIVRLCESTRANVVLTSPDGRQMRFNHAGPKLSRAEVGKVLQGVRQNLARCDLLVLSGSLPRGMPVTTYARLIRLARRHGIRTLLDCDGAAFAAAVKSRPFLVKPNDHELAQWCGKRLPLEADVVRAARELSEATRGWVLVSRGAKSGLLVNAAEGLCLRARPPRVTARNRLGAGDAFLAGAAYQIALGAPPADWLRNALATGTASTHCTPGTLPKPTLLARLLRELREP